MADNEYMAHRVCTCVFLLSVFASVPAFAQFNVPAPVAPGEDFKVELGAMFWSPTPELAINTDALDVAGIGEVDFVQEFDILEKRFTEFRVTLKPARKHKLRFQYIPFKYDPEVVMLERTITFAGRTFTVGLPADAEVEWKMWRFGYEWDFISRSRGFLGVLAELRRTELSAELSSLVASGAVLAEAPLPSIGIVSRVYPLPDLALNFEFSGFKVPETDGDYEGTYTDLEVSAMVNISNNLGVSAGWRRLSTDIRIERDFGDLKFSGIWFGGAIRF